MDELLSVLPILLIFFGVFAFSGFAAKLRQAQQAAQRQSSEPDREEPAKKQPATPAAKPAPNNGFSSGFARSYDTDRIGWDSLSEFHEGEDPCHDDMETIAAQAEDPASAHTAEAAKELMKGFVIGEILARRTPMTARR